MGVAGVSAGALAGCVAHPEVVLTLDEVSDGELADIAPTILALLGVDRPAEMTGRSLLAPPGPSRPQD